MNSRSISNPKLIKNTGRFYSFQNLHKIEEATNCVSNNLSTSDSEYNACLFEKAEPDEASSNELLRSIYEADYVRERKIEELDNLCQDYMSQNRRTFNEMLSKIQATESQSFELINQIKKLKNEVEYYKEKLLVVNDQNQFLHNNVNNLF